jgi:hypothetical protein
MEPSVETSTSEHPLTVKLLGAEVPLPVGATVARYQTHHKKKLTKEAFKKKKYKTFSYYKVKQEGGEPTIVKVLFLDESNYLHVSEYPFIVETYQLKKFQELNDQGPERLTVSEALLIGERNEEVVVRKLHLCEFMDNEGSIDTIKDEFEKIATTNSARFNKVSSFLKESVKDNNNPSMRVFVQEEGEEAKVLDFDYFHAEKKCLETFKK